MKTLNSMKLWSVLLAISFVAFSCSEDDDNGNNNEPTLKKLFTSNNSNGNLTIYDVTDATNISTTTGHFGNLLVDNQIITDADLSVSGNAFVTSGVNVGGDVTVSGTVTTHSDFIVLSGQAEFPWGTQTAPGITFTGDLNTGFYNPSGENDCCSSQW